MSAPRAVLRGIPLLNAGLCVDCPTIYDVGEYPKGCPRCLEPGFIRISAALNPKWREAR